MAFVKPNQEPQVEKFADFPVKSFGSITKQGKTNIQFVTLETPVGDLTVRLSAGDAYVNSYLIHDEGEHTVRVRVVNRPYINAEGKAAIQKYEANLLFHTVATEEQLDEAFAALGL